MPGYCVKCGKPIEDDALFCVYCGTAVPSWVLKDSHGEESTISELSNNAAQSNRQDNNERDVSLGGSSFPSSEMRNRPSNTIRITPATTEQESPVQDYESRPVTAKSNNTGKFVPIIIVALIIAAIIAALFVLKIIPAQTQPQLTNVSTQNASNTNTPEESKSIPVRNALNDYSWNEISGIAQMMEASSNRSEAIKIAAEYNLVDSDGKLNGALKTLTLANGDTVLVQIAGIMHDDLADGSGKAALTFITKNSYIDRPMNSKDTNVGGWESSDMRRWLNSTVVEQFPSDVNPVSVVKKSNNTGVSESPTVVTDTSDRLFLFSWKELLGNISWGTTNDAIFNEEGSQYQLFSDFGVSGTQDNDPKGILYKYHNDSSTERSIWWTRSAKPNQDDGFGDFDNGEADNGGKSSTAQGTVFGFCL